MTHGEMRRYGYKPHSSGEYEELTAKIRSEMMERNIVVTKDRDIGDIGHVDARGHEFRCILRVVP